METRTRRDKEGRRKKKERVSETITGTGGMALTRERILREQTGDENRSDETRVPKTCGVRRAISRSLAAPESKPRREERATDRVLSAVHRGYTHERRKQSR